MCISVIYVNQIVFAKDIVRDVHVFVYVMSYENAMFILLLVYCLCNLCPTAQYLVYLGSGRSLILLLSSPVDSYH